MTSRQIGIIAALSLGLGIMAANPAHAVSNYGEGIFDNSGLTAIEALDDSPGGVNTFTADQVLTGGNLDQFLRNTLTVVSNSSLLGATLSNGFDFDPSGQGAISSVRFSLDAKFLGGTAGTSQFGVRLLVQQNGTNYTTGAGALALTLGAGGGQPGSWTHFEFGGLTSNSFTRIGGAGEHPDFSASGPPINFGLVSSVSASATGLSITGGVDNLSLRVLDSSEVDLAVTKTASTNAVAVGSNLTYTVTVTNIGGVVATGVTMEDSLPAGLTFVSATPSQGTCTNDGSDVSCNLGTITNSQSASVAIVVVPTAAGVITNFASASAAESEPATDDNTGSVVTTIFSINADLTAELTSSSAVCGPDAKMKNTICTVDGTLTFRNAGVPYIVADYTLTKSCKVAPKVGCKMTACLTFTTLDLGSLPDHNIQFYLSDDNVLDENDTPLVKKVTPTTKLLKAFAKGTTYCVKFKLASGTDPAGKYLIIKVDDTNVLAETNESNNTAVYGPIP